VHEGYWAGHLDDLRDLLDDLRDLLDDLRDLLEGA
jgi:hypothetical protein